jgi:tRNA dimethylallyltransferase
MADLSKISRERPVLLFGPTASGKSGLAMELAARDGRLIVNADALQVFGNWRHLTARPSAADEAALPHALYGHLARSDAYSVGAWLRDLAPHLTRPVVIVGGTGLYFMALTQGLAQIPASPPEVRAEADALRSTGRLAEMLSQIDPETQARIDVANPMRVQRAWEVWRATGRGLAAWQAETGPALIALEQAEPLVLRPDVCWLDARITRRFHAMIAAGALAEARAEAPHYDPALPSAKAIGAAELIGHLRGESSLDQAIAAAILASRQYAKRQRTWGRSRMAEWREIAI